MNIVIGSTYFIESEEQPVKVLEAEPCEASVLSTEPDAMEYRVELADGSIKWTFQDDFMDVEVDGEDPFIF